MSVILATQEAEIRNIVVQIQPGQIVHETLSQKHPSQKKKEKEKEKELVEWLRVQTLSSNLSTAK
jgi:sporulation protein YlmC with PRC-barrel domain